MESLDKLIMKRTASMTSDIRRNILAFLCDEDEEIYEANLKLFQKVKVLDLLLLGSLVEEAGELFDEIMEDAEERIEELKQQENKEMEIVELRYLMIILIYTMNRKSEYEKYGEPTFFEMNTMHRDIRKLKEYYEKMSVSVEEELRNIIRRAEMQKNFELANELKEIQEKGIAGQSQHLTQLGSEYAFEDRESTKYRRRIQQYTCYELATIDIRSN